MNKVTQCTVQSGGQRATREVILDNAARAASALDALGVGWGDTVAVMMRNDLVFLEAIFACDQLGACSVAVNWHFQKEEIAYILSDSAAKVMVIHADLLPPVREAIPESIRIIVVPPHQTLLEAYGLPLEQGLPVEGQRTWQSMVGDHEPWPRPVSASPGSVIYTSGTTGRPKGVKREPLDAATAERSRRSRAHIQGSSEGMRALMASPLYHAGPNATARTAVALASYLNIMPRFDGEEMLRIIERERITNLSVVPTMLVRLLALPDAVKQRYDLSSLEQVVHGAGPCPPETKRRIIDWFGPIVTETYGSTEVGLVTRCTSEEWLQRPGTVGRPVAGVSVRVMGDDGDWLPPGQQGELFIHNGNAGGFSYLNAPDATQAVTREGHITNGDVGYLDDQGYLYITDRKRDMIISGGVNIYPAEIEAVLQQCPGVHDCAVFGIADPQYGEAVAAAVVAMPDWRLDTDAIRAYLSTRIARYKVPRHIRFHADLPREAMGKVFKNKLREAYRASPDSNA
ncbi:AMP-binding protein [Alloalcanivorax mobilis]|uniref:AMP-binding protein n=1 Tax=Alloalcanivorax mobilis TaxID=2019569 RepID=UPI000B5B3569|nr:AMP-binding protein [Alloalcanivorax mobilis]ASK34212.1 long-chain fatty acid--CoA ligase [Alcanivorax sp. N3-2A]|tara:strand:+ start:20562 stop:22103 length:1542 start_codon:yes stop_codon:yes gene_type:complete